MKFSLLAALLLLGVCGALAGCSESSDNKPATPEDIKAFKGGTPPPDVQKKLNEAAQNAQKGAKVNI